MGQALEMCVHCDHKRSCDTCTDLHNWIMEYLDKKPVKQGWINVNDRLPPPDQKVICIGGNGGIFPATKLGPNRLLMRNDKWRIWADHQSKWRTFVWWIPIPELPEGMNGE